MRLRARGTLDELRAAVKRLGDDEAGLAAWGRFPDELRNGYLTWIASAEEVARRHLRDVPADQFATNRHADIRDRRVPSERLWQVVNGDAGAQLDWFDSVIADLGSEAVEAIVDRSGADPWRPGCIRVFISHLSGYKEFASDVSESLAPLDIQGFVAHDTIEVSLEWQRVLESALSTAHVLVGLVHPGFVGSYWSQQEVGWALGRGLPTLMIRLGEDPRGFTAKYQAPSMVRSRPSAVANAIAVWLSENPTFGATVIASLVHDLRTAGSYTAGRSAAERIEALGKLSTTLLDEIEAAYLGNDQLYPRHVGGRVIERILKAHGRNLPQR